MDQEALHGRREARRRAVRRRRRLTAGLITAVIAVAVVVVLAGGSGRKSATVAHPTRSGRPPGNAHSSPGRSSIGATSAGSVTGPPGTRPVPILTYHVIAAPPAGAPFPGLYVTPNELSAQVHALKSAGWHAVTLDQVKAYWTRGVPLGPGKPVVLTFDNGYQSQYTQALPVLAGIGWVADENIQLTGLPPSQGGLSRQQVRGLVNAGWELDTQGVSHADLITLDAEQLREQVAGARHTIQQRYQVPVHWFCYPSGHYDATVIAAVRAAGFTGSTTVVSGWARPQDDPYRLPRLRVLGGTTPSELLSLIAAARGDQPAPSSYG
jgi:peptidoglycan/xylan/chitin deacetylase (PgdA/CDA1 family)